MLDQFQGSACDIWSFAGADCNLPFAAGTPDRTLANQVGEVPGSGRNSRVRLNIAISRHSSRNSQGTLTQSVVTAPHLAVTEQLHANEHVWDYAVERANKQREREGRHERFTDPLGSSDKALVSSATVLTRCWRFELTGKDSIASKNLKISKPEGRNGDRKSVV